MTDFVLASLVNNKVALQEAKKLVVITEDNFDEIVSEIKTLILGEIDDREADIIKDNGDSLPERLCDGKNCTDETHNHVKEEELTPYEAYESVVPVPTVNGEAVSDGAKAQKIEALIAEIKADCVAIETRLTAFNEYLSELVQAEVLDGKTSNKEIAFKNKINDIVDNYVEQKYVSNLQEYINSRINIEPDEVVEKYKDLLREEQQKYADDSFVKTYEGATDKTYLYYDTDNKYFHVQHILLQFDKDDVDTLKALAGYGVGEDGVSPEEWAAYVAARNSYVESISASYKSLDGTTAKDGYGNELKIAAADLVGIVNAVANSTELTNAQKATEYRKLVYIYGQDPGMQTNDIFGYTFTANRADLEDSSVDGAGFVDEFIDEAYRLYGELGTSECNIATNYIVTDHGIHILMVYGETQEGAVCEANENAMKSTIISDAYGQSVYEYVYAILLEERQKTEYNNFIDAAKENYNIEYILTTYDEIFK